MAHGKQTVPCSCVQEEKNDVLSAVTGNACYTQGGRAGFFVDGVVCAQAKGVYNA